MDDSKSSNDFIGSNHEAENAIETSRDSTDQFITKIDQSSTSNQLDSTQTSGFGITRGMFPNSDDLRKVREARVNETLKMKDEQIRILTEHNSKLISSLEKIEEDSNQLQMEKLSFEQENRNLRDQNFELQSKSRIAETQSKRLQLENDEKDKQIHILTDQHTELLRLLESEEQQTTNLQKELKDIQQNLSDIQSKYTTLLSTAKSHEDIASKAIKESQLHIEEIRLLRTENEHYKQTNIELKMKTQIELENMNEQLRIRKEKQYQLLEKIQNLEEIKKQSTDQIDGMNEQLRLINNKLIELENQVNIEKQLKLNYEEVNKQLQIDNNNIYQMNKELTSKIDIIEKERLSMEMEAKDNAEQLKDMAEKIFQLLERLKLSELGKTKSMEALKKKENEMISLTKKNNQLLKELTNENKLRIKLELDIKISIEQIKSLKKLINELNIQLKELTNKNNKLNDEKVSLNNQIITYESRLSFLLNKVTLNEESNILSNEDNKKLQTNLITMNEKCTELTSKLTELTDNNRLLIHTMKTKQEEYNELSLKYEQLKKDYQFLQEDTIKPSNNKTLMNTTIGINNESQLGNVNNTEIDNKDHILSDHSQQMNDYYTTKDTIQHYSDDIEHVRINHGRGRFYIEGKSMNGGLGTLFYIKGKKLAYQEWLKKHSLNDYIKKSQKSNKFRELIIEKMCHLCGLYMVEEEENHSNQQEIKRLNHINEKLNQKIHLYEQLLLTEEDAKRRILLRYIHSVKEHSMILNQSHLTESNGNIDQSVGMIPPTIPSSFQGGIIQLPESNITDEEVHALAALLRNNVTIESLILRGNRITDDGARALANVLSGKSNLRNIDLRGNKISNYAIRILAEGLERSERVKHVYVHAGGKIEALGEGNKKPTETQSNIIEETLEGETKPLLSVETVCIVDVRDNNPDQTQPGSNGALNPYELLTLETTNQILNASLSKPREANTVSTPFHPRDLVPPPQTAFSQSLLKKSKALQIKNQTRSSTAIPWSSNQSAALVYLGNDEDTRKNKIKQIQDEIRESAWNGRAGMEQSLLSQNPSSAAEQSSFNGNHKKSRQSRAMTSQTNAASSSSFQLPPLTDFEPVSQGLDGRLSSTASSIDNPRGKTALSSSMNQLRTISPSKPISHETLDLDGNKQGLSNDPTEELVRNVLIKVKKNKGIKSLKTSETEKRLFVSPFAQPLVKESGPSKSPEKPQL